MTLTHGEYQCVSLSESTHEITSMVTTSTSSSSSYLAFSDTNPHNHHLGTNNGKTSFCPYATCHDSPICGPCNQRFIFIAAMGRSGSTTLLKIMNALSKVRLAGENHGELNIASLVESNLK